MAQLRACDGPCTQAKGFLRFSARRVPLALLLESLTLFLVGLTPEPTRPRFAHTPQSPPRSGAPSTPSASPVSCHPLLLPRVCAHISPLSVTRPIASHKLTHHLPCPSFPSRGRSCHPILRLAHLHLYQLSPKSCHHVIDAPQARLDGIICMRDLEHSLKLPEARFRVASASPALAIPLLFECSEG